MRDAYNVGPTVRRQTVLLPRRKRCKEVAVIKIISPLGGVLDLDNENEASLWDWGYGYD